MKRYYSIDDYAKTGYKSRVALGFFDGVHLGHRAVIGDCVKNKSDRKAVVLTFGDSPARLLTGNGISLITDNEKKALLTEQLGVDAIIFADFMQLKDLTPQDFVDEILIKKLRAEKISCGYDYRFGKNGSGDIETLKTLCEKADAAVSVIRPVTCGGRTVSSSAIRELLADGDIETANKMLGAPYTVCGDIGEGNHLGTGMGFPTVNLPIKKGLTVPRFGVYASWITIGGRRFRGATNIGVHPTVGENDAPLCETFLLDYRGEDLYGEKAVCEPVRFIRPEQRFASGAELAAQITKDIETIKGILK